MEEFREICLTELKQVVRKRWLEEIRMNCDRRLLESWVKGDKLGGWWEGYGEQDQLRVNYSRMMTSG